MHVQPHNMPDHISLLSLLLRLLNFSLSEAHITAVKMTKRTRILQRLYVHDDEIGRGILPLRMLIEQQPWGLQYNAPLGSGQGRAELTLRLNLFAFPDNPSPPLATPSDALEKRFGKEILLQDNILPPANVFGFLQVSLQTLLLQPPSTSSVLGAELQC
jgi:hypothetical protein